MAVYQPQTTGKGNLFEKIHSFTKYFRKDDTHHHDDVVVCDNNAMLKLPQIELYKDSCYVSVDRMDINDSSTRVSLYGGDIAALNMVIAVKTLYVSLGTFDVQHFREYSQYRVSGRLRCSQPGKYVLIANGLCVSQDCIQPLEWNTKQKQIHLPDVKEECDVRRLLLIERIPLFTLTRICMRTWMSMFIKTLLVMHNEMKTGNLSSKECSFFNMSDKTALSLAICVGIKLNGNSLIHEYDFAQMLSVLSLIPNTLHNKISKLLDMCKDDDDRLLLLIYVTLKSPTLTQMGTIFDHFDDSERGSSELIKSIIYRVTQSDDGHKDDTFGVAFRNLNNQRLHHRSLYKLLRKCKTNEQRTEIIKLLESTQHVIFNDIPMKHILKIYELLENPDLFNRLLVTVPPNFENLSQALASRKFSDDDKLILLKTTFYRGSIATARLILQTFEIDQYRNAAIKIITQCSDKYNFEDILSEWELQKANSEISNTVHVPDVSKQTEMMVLKNENSKNESASMCIICMENPSCCAFVPCGHMCICAKCCSRSNECPICRTPIERILKIITASSTVYNSIGLVS